MSSSGRDRQSQLASMMGSISFELMRFHDAPPQTRNKRSCIRKLKWLEDQCRRAMNESWAAPPFWEYLEIAASRARFLRLAIQTDALGVAYEINGERVLPPSERPEFWGWLSSRFEPQESSIEQAKLIDEVLFQLSHAERSIIQQMYESGDTITEPGTKRDILNHAGYPHSEESWRLLRNLEIVETRRGANGGSWLTELGLSIAKQIVPQEVD